jgi:hypothetical protein
VLADDVADEEEAEAGALDLDRVAAGNAVEAVEDALVLVGRKTEAGVGDEECDLSVAGDGQGAADVDSAGGVLDGVVQEVEDGGAEVFGDAEDVEANGSWDGIEDDGFGGKVVALKGDGDAVVDEGGEVDGDAVLLAMTLAELAGLEDLLDGAEETVGVGEHVGVELLALTVVDWPSLEGLEVEADARDGGLELVGYGVEEGVLTLVAADLADEEDSVEDDSGDEYGEEDKAEDSEGDCALVEEYPGALRDGEADENGAEGDEKGDGSAASGDVHGLVKV